MNMGFVGKAFSLNSFRCIASFKWAIRMISICSIRIRIQPMDDWRMGEICFSIGNCKQKLLLQFDATTKTRFSLKSKNNNNHSHSRATFPHLTWHFFFFLGSSLAFNENFTVYRNVFLRLVPSKLFDWFFFSFFLLGSCGAAQYVRPIVCHSEFCCCCAFGLKKWRQNLHINMYSSSTTIWVQDSCQTFWKIQ